MSKNPFKPGTASFNDFKILEDLKWHCVKHELESGQAKTWQQWRQRGIQFEANENGRFERRFFCDTCKKKTVHRRLLTLEILEQTSIRSGISNKLSAKIKTVLKYEEAIYLRKLTPKELEIDHKFPQVRWSKNEDENRNDMSEKEIRDKFILLTRANNLFKSRQCERCKKTGKRSSFPGIYFWYQGNEDWDLEINWDDESGCIGCFWHNPYKWREELNKLIK